MLDNREVKSQQERQAIANDLRQKGIPVDQRALQLGDVLWVARSSTKRGEYAEVAVDAILERKRMDDLCGSVKDGRFHDQKVSVDDISFSFFG